VPVFLSPLGSLVALAALLPLGAAVLRERRLAAARRLLGLPGPGRRAYATAAAAAAAVGLLALAAAQPALSRSEGAVLRTDAEAYVVLDNSRSMEAVEQRGGPTRFDRARQLALRLRDALPDVPWGVASFNDRTLVHAFPTGDRSLFAATLEQSVAVGRPRPAFREKRATELSALAAGGGFFRPSTRKRLFVLLTDGESQPFAAAQLAQRLRAKRARLVVVRFWNARERVYDGAGRDLGYRPDATSAEQLAALPPLGVRVLPATEPGTVAAAARRLLGRGPVRHAARERHVVPLTGGLVLAAILPLGFVLVRTRR
jgi:VWA domain-containing protein